MTAPFSTVGGYGGNPSVVVDPATGLASALVDTADGFTVLYPSINPATGFLQPFVIDPIPISPAIGMPEINALLCELRVLVTLIREQMGDTRTSFDLQTMRADEAWSTSYPNPASLTSTTNASGAL